ncbi:Unknown protein [Striga hermonthica]|uniref:Chromo domain-containing protein n=1 Tax=Striga hermonthica TaxID=68872 RepID=A0A9N7N2B9_STRHE|nr:Unknown protein [Striga hermonthica]
MVKTWEEQPDLTRSYLEKAHRRMKKGVDSKRRPKKFSPGDLVLVKLLPQQFKTFRSLHKGLIRKYEGPYPMDKKVGNVAYRVDLPPTLKIHLVFHVSMLNPYKGDVGDQAEVRRRGVSPKKRYLIKWEGLPVSEASWEIEEDLLLQIYPREIRDDEDTDTTGGEECNAPRHLTRVDSSCPAPTRVAPRAHRQRARTYARTEDWIRAHTGLSDLLMT